MIRSVFAAQNAVEQTYQKLVDDTLQKFRPQGLTRQRLCEIHQRWNRDACLIQILSKRIYWFGTPEMNTTPARMERLRNCLTLTQRVLKKRRLPDVEFLVCLADSFGVPDFPVFSSFFKSTWGNVSFPLGQSQQLTCPQGGTNIVGWNRRMANFRKVAQAYPWKRRIEKAVFRGAFRMQSQSKDWRDVPRGRLFCIAQQRCDLLDVGFTAVRDPNHQIPEEILRSIPTTKAIPMEHQQQYKYALNVGSNTDWADRLRMILFMSSAVIKHEADSHEFFYALLKPYEHYIPTRPDFSDLAAQIEWARAHDKEVRAIVQRANEFAVKYLSEKAMCHYAFILIKEYAQLLTYKVERHPLARKYEAAEDAPWMTAGAPC
ncbi:MAG: glycosyl transferase family 90 [Candidatus Omnitrophica bacterium]|nr:glycosyl transferase family 90 [Candidatus Omnitrophota bacterium]MDD5671187.1 glycosyl transferase family 90 [Candidatus Omnitrophota bacterium]